MPPRRGVIDRVRRWRTTSDALCRTPISAQSLDRASLGAPRTASIASPSRDTTCSTQNAFHRQVLPRGRFRVPNFGGSPPPGSRLCHRGPGFRPAFAAPMLSPGTTRPDVGSGSSSLLDATGHMPPVDFCNPTAIREHFRRIVRTPRTALVVAHMRSCFSSHRLSTAERSAGGLASYGMANRAFTGQGPALGRSAH
jgi:hypothetical protein